MKHAKILAREIPQARVTITIVIIVTITLTITIVSIIIIIISIVIMITIIMFIPQARLDKINKQKAEGTYMSKAEKEPGEKLII